MELIAISTNDFKDIQEKIDKMLRLITSKESQSLPKLITNQELISGYGISKETAKKWRQKNYLPFHKVGRKIFYDEEEVIKAFKNHSQLTFRLRQKKQPK